MTPEQGQEIAEIRQIWRSAKMEVDEGEPHPRSGVVALTIGAPPGAILVLYVDTDGNRIAAAIEPRSDMPEPPTPEPVQEALAL